MGCGFGSPLCSPERLNPLQVVAEPGEPPGLAAEGGSRVKTKERDLKKFPLTSDELCKYHAIIVNPPRSGAKLQFLNIARSNVSIIISISCNINTFVRDAKILIEGNYKLKWVQPIDQFLFSAHVELVAIFQLKYKNVNKKIYNYKKT